MKCLFLQYRLGLVGSHRFVFADGGGEQPSELVKAIAAKEKEMQKEAGKKKPDDEKKDIVKEEDVQAGLKAAREKVEKSALAEPYKGKIKDVLGTLEKKRIDDVKKLTGTEEEKLKKLVVDIEKELADFEKLEGVREFMVFADNKEQVKNALTIKVFGRGSGHWKIVNENLAKSGITQDRLRAVQKLIGVDEDGKAGPATMNALNTMLGLGLSEVTWGADTVMRAGDKNIGNPNRKVAAREKAKGEKAVKSIAKAPAAAGGDKAASAPTATPTTPGGPAPAPDDGVPKEKTLGDGSTGTPDDTSNMPPPAPGYAPPTQPGVQPGGSVEMPAPQPGAQSDIQRPDNVQFKRERESGFARMYNSPEVQQQFNQLGEQDKQKILKEMTPTLTEQQRFRLQQVNMMRLALQAAKDNIEHARTMGEWLDQALTETDKTTSGRKVAIDRMLGVVDSFETIVKNDPDKSFSDTTSGVTSINTFFDHAGLNTLLLDAKDHGDVQQKYIALIGFLRSRSDYDRARDLIEDTLLGPQFEAERAKMKDDELKLTEASRSKIKKEIAESDFRKKCYMQGLDPITDSGKIDQMELALVNDLVEVDVKRGLNKLIAERSKGLPFAELQGNDRQIMELYKDMMGTGEFYNFSDATWDTIRKEVIINAPLIIISGGAASLARTAATNIARGAVSMTTRGLSAGAEALINSGKFIRAARFGMRAADVGEKLIATGRSGRMLYWGVGKVAGAVVEGAAFEAVHTGLQGESLLDAPDWAKRILISSVTLGTFHLAGAGANTMHGYILKNWTKFGEAGLGNVGRIMQKLTIAGSTETATMLAVGAAQHALEQGNLKDYHFVDELFHALISVGALKIGGRFAEFGGKKLALLGKRAADSMGGGPGGGPKGGAPGGGPEGALRAVEVERASRSYGVGDTVSVLTPQSSGKNKGVLKPTGGWEITGIKERDNGVKIFTVEKTDKRGKTTRQDVPEDFLLRKPQDAAAKTEGARGDDAINRVGVDRVGENMPEVGRDAKAAAKSFDAALSDAAAQIADPVVRGRARAVIDSIATFVARPTRATWQAAAGLWKGFIGLSGRGFDATVGRFGRGAKSFFEARTKSFRERAARAAEEAKAKSGEEKTDKNAETKPEAPKDEPKSGDTVWTRRTSGDLEYGWKISFVDPDGGIFLRPPDGPAFKGTGLRGPILRAAFDQAQRDGANVPKPAAEHELPKADSGKSEKAPDAGDAGANTPITLPDTLFENGRLRTPAEFSRLTKTQIDALGPQIRGDHRVAERMLGLTGTYTVDDIDAAYRLATTERPGSASSDVFSLAWSTLQARLKSADAERAAGAGEGMSGVERARKNLAQWESKTIKDRVTVSSQLNAIEYADKPGQWFIFHESECALGEMSGSLFDFPSGGKGRVIATEQPAVVTGTRDELRLAMSERGYINVLVSQGKIQKGRLVMDMEMRKAA